MKYRIKKIKQPYYSGYLYIPTYKYLWFYLSFYRKTTEGKDMILFTSRQKARDFISEKIKEKKK